MKSSGTAIPAAAPRPPDGSPSCSCRAPQLSEHVDLFDGVLIDVGASHAFLRSHDVIMRRGNRPGGQARRRQCRGAFFPSRLFGADQARTSMCNCTSEVRCFASPRNDGSEFPHIIRRVGTADKPHGGLRVRLCVRIASSCNRPRAGANRRPVPRSRRNRASVKDAQASTHSSLRYR
jgi:hypothetical protein